MKYFKATITTLVIGAIFMSSNAFADSIGQCNIRPNNNMSSVNQWQQTLSQEGVISQTKVQIFSNAGFVAVDQSVRQWMNERVLLSYAHYGFSGNDYGCRNGSLFGAGTRSYGAGKVVFFVLPGNYSKSSISTRKTRTFSRSVVIRVKVVGLGNCANPLEANAYVVIYIRAKHSKPKPRHTVTPTQVNKCQAGQFVASNGNCVNQSNTSSENCGNGQIHSATGCITVQINNNCGNVSVNGSPSQGGNCNQTIEEKPCGCIVTPPPPPPICPPGTVGTPPNCKEKPEPYNLMFQQEVEANKTSYICASVRSPAGDTLRVHFYAHFGYFTESEAFQNSAYGGKEGYCEQYKAPIDVLEDHFWVYVEDVTTGLHSATEKEALKEAIKVIPETF